jgi:ADP-ribose pyrophosphatase YjhB (NUDIX family)
VRVIAVGVVLHGDYLLLAEGHDRVKGQTFYRGLGGEIEFGERSADAVCRELREELGVGVESRALLGVLENHFALNGTPGHEIVFEHLLEFAPGEAPPDREPLEAREGDAVFVARWLSVAETLAGTYRVYPEGFEERLAAWLNTL